MKVNIEDYPDGDEERVINVEIESFDTYSLDHTLALIILPALKEFKDDNGDIYVKDEDVPENIRSTSARPREKEYMEDEFYADRSTYVLDEMIWAFQQIVNDGELDSEEEKVCETKDYDAIEALHQRVDNGTRLFDVYFRKLWW